MSNLYISVWTDAAAVALGDVEQSETVAIGVSSTQSNVITQNNTLPRKRVRLFAEASCFVAWGTNPTASATGVPLGAENPEYFDIPVGHKIAVIQR